jgi:hypothetical protein
VVNQGANLGDVASIRDAPAAVGPVALLLITIDRQTFTGSAGDAPVVRLG